MSLPSKPGAARKGFEKYDGRKESDRECLKSTVCHGRQRRFDTGETQKTAPVQ